MPSIHVPYVNIALNAFALVITLIIFVSCLNEYSAKKIGTRHFLLLQLSVIVALVANIIGWCGEGRPQLAVMNLVGNTVAACACQIAIISFMGYLTASLYDNNRVATCILNLFRVFCVLSVLLCLGNAYFGYYFSISSQGHCIHSKNGIMGFLYLLFPNLSFLAVILMSLLAKRTAKINRFAFIIYTLFPVLGLIIDYWFHGASLTYLGFTVSILVIYTSIYINRQKQLEAQKNALMLSQINPHFVYNTLSTIASMCDTSPKQAKYLTIDFSQYLRRNIDTLSCEDLIPFEKELEHVECYLKIEKARFRERLNISYSIGCRDFRVPPLSIQPLVENAVKHGITKKASGGTLRILTFEEDTDYIVRIIDDGVGFDAENANLHVGLQNVRSRLAATCRGELTVKSTVGVGTRVTIVIPKKKGKIK